MAPELSVLARKATTATCCQSQGCLICLLLKWAWLAWSLDAGAEHPVLVCDRASVHRGLCQCTCLQHARRPPQILGPEVGFQSRAAENISTKCSPCEL